MTVLAAPQRKAVVAPAARASLAGRQPSPRYALPALQAMISPGAGGQPLSQAAAGGEPRAAGRLLDPPLRREMEAYFRHDFAGVRLHVEPPMASLPKALGARAFTFGTDVVFAPGQYAPSSAAGRELLAHELTHVVQQSRAGPALQLAAAAPAQPDARESEAQVQARRLARQKLFEELQSEARRDAQTIMDVFTGHSLLLRGGNEAAIMAIVERWAERPAPPTGWTPLDHLVARLQLASFKVGFFVEQQTSAFDQIFHRFSARNRDRFQTLLSTRARQFKDDKAVAEARFEVRKEDVVKAAKLTLSLAGAVATGGASIAIEIASWLLNTLPNLYRTATTIIDFVTTIRNTPIEEVKQRFSPAGLGELLVRVLFGEVPGLPLLQPAGEEEKQQAEPPAREGGGLLHLLHVVQSAFNAGKRAYNGVAKSVNAVLAALNLPAHSWFKPVAATYWAVAKAVQLVSDPAAAMRQLAAKLRESIDSFFERVKGQVSDASKRIRDRIADFLDARKLLNNLADKAVSWVLNFLITNPPSELLRAVFEVIQTVAEEDLVTLVRRKIPGAEALVKKIAESSPVQAILSPLQRPAQALSGAVGRLSDRALGVVEAAHGQARGLFAGSAGLVQRFTGVDVTKPAPDPSPPRPGPAAAEGDGAVQFFEALRTGFHGRMMQLGQSAAGELAQTLFRRGLQTLARKAGEIIGRKEPVRLGSESHEMWIEQRADGPQVIIASSQPELLLQQVTEVEADLGGLQVQESAAIQAEIDRIRELAGKASQEAAGQVSGPSDPQRLQNRVARLTKAVEQAHEKVRATEKTAEYAWLKEEPGLESVAQRLVGRAVRIVRHYIGFAARLRTAGAALIGPAAEVPPKQYGVAVSGDNWAPARPDPDEHAFEAQRALKANEHAEQAIFRHAKGRFVVRAIAASRKFCSKFCRGLVENAKMVSKRVSIAEK